MQILNTYHVGYPDLDRTGASFLTVLIGRTEGTYKVYSGLVQLPDPSSEEYEAERQRAAHKVMRSGNPESYDRAVTFFPNLSREKYA